MPGDIKSLYRALTAYRENQTRTAAFDSSAADAAITNLAAGLRQNSLLARRRQNNAMLAYRPKISVVIVAGDPQPALLDETIESIRQQSYDDWELCIATGSEEMAAPLPRHVATDDRIRVTTVASSLGFSAAANAALAGATGEFVTTSASGDGWRLMHSYEV